MTQLRQVDQGHQRRLIAEQLQQVRQRRKHLHVDGHLGTRGTSETQPPREPIGIRGRVGQIGIGRHIEQDRRMPRVPDIAGQPVGGRVRRIDLRGIGPRQVAPVGQCGLPVIVGRERRDEAVFPDQHLLVAVPPLITQPPPPVRRPAGHVDQKAVEPVALLEFAQRPHEHFAVEPDVRRIVIAVQEIVPQRQLAHHRHPIRPFVPHGARDAFARIHGRLRVWQWLYPPGHDIYRTPRKQAGYQRGQGNELPFQEFADRSADCFLRANRRKCGNWRGRRRVLLFVYFQLSAGAIPPRRLDRVPAPRSHPRTTVYTKERIP